MFCYNPSRRFPVLTEPYKNSDEVNQMVRPKQLGHVNIRVRDLEKSEKFYSEVLGLEVTHRRDRIVFFSLGDLSHELAITPMGDDATGPDSKQIGTNHFAWEMASFEDLQAMYRQLNDHGVEVHHTRDNTFSVGIYFTDPDGNGNEVYIEDPGAPWRSGTWEGEYRRKLEEVTA